MKPILLLDFDGVLNVLAFEHPDTWNNWVFGNAETVRADAYGVWWSPDMIAAIKSFDVEIRWLTTWWDSIPALDFLGLGRLPIANTEQEFHKSRTGWWKLQAAQRIRAETGAPIIWIDDDIRHDQGAIKWIAECNAVSMRTHPGSPPSVYTISPRPELGITPNDINGLKAHLHRLAKHGMDPVK